MPYLSIKNQEAQKKQEMKKSHRIEKFILLLVICCLIMFFCYQIYREVKLFNDLKIKYDNLTNEYDKLKSIYEEKIAIMKDLQRKLAEKGVDEKDGSINATDSNNIQQTQEGTGTKGPSTLPGI